MIKACSELGAAKDEFVSSAARRVLERSEWYFPKVKSGGGSTPARQFELPWPLREHHRPCAAPACCATI